MDGIIDIAVIGLALALGIGLVRVVLGPTIGDRLLSLQLVGTTGVAFLIVLSGFGLKSGLIDTALVLALLTPITTTAFLAIISKIEK